MELIFWIGIIIVTLVTTFLAGYGLAAVEERYGIKKTYLICGLPFFLGIVLITIALLF